MTSRVWRVAPLLFGSGLCALVYQTVWLREFRLIFGASTAASAAVLAIFMAGLGLGSALLGARADRQPRPLGFYANLELLIAGSAALSPFLVELARSAYLGAGGTVTLGLFFGTVVRLVLSALVLAVPTILMGGTLPAAARAVESDEDPHRRHLAILYGVNTLGAVTGATLATFFLLEVFGNRTTLWMACLLNALVAIIARSVSRSMEGATAPASAPAEVSTAPVEATPALASVPLPPRGFVLLAAALAGFAFLLMELVWYRMLGPILGGSTFTFGLILAVALLGIGLGGGAYALWFRHRPATLAGFALTCAAEAAFIALPFALGDRLAVVSALLRQLGGLGFGGMVLSWSLIASVVVLPAAFIAGIQFPLLLALIGRGGKDVGRHVGQVYAWNTLGSITGSLAGGFGVLPLLTAPVTWQLVACVLALLGLGSAVLSFRGERMRMALLAPVATAVLALVLLLARGPTAAWRHGSVGAGRSGLVDTNLNDVDAWLRSQRRSTVWEAEGVESSVALFADNGLAFIVNGKSDGNALGDAPTQVMGGMVGALLHPDAKSAMVIGLGTGSTAGWLGAIPRMERVDVVEIEPAILEVARRCAPVNEGVMDNPKVQTFIGDAREVLLASRQRYDIVFSEPSNPYRAGIASLFTRDFYQAVKERLADGGIFLQWLQAYEVDALTVRSAYATLTAEFESVETWQLTGGDLLLVATHQPLAHDAAKLRARVAEEPYRSALHAAWRTDELEGLLARFMATPALARKVAEGNDALINTDDLSFMEFAFARSLGRSTGFSASTLWEASRKLGLDRPQGLGEGVDWERVEQLRAWENVPPPASASATQQAYRAFLADFSQGRFSPALARWKARGTPPRGPREQVAIIQLLAMAGDEEALKHIEVLRARRPSEADLLEGMLRVHQNRPAEATAVLERAFAALRQDPWAPRDLIEAVLQRLPTIAGKDKALGRRLYDALALPFSVESQSRVRKLMRVQLASLVDWEALCVEALAPLEPEAPWNLSSLTLRRDCYTKKDHPLAETALEELERFIAQAPPAFLPESEEQAAVPEPAPEPGVVAPVPP
ncbi:MAG TPA: fused MFS/spermidine synthase [Myxococcus sp.]|nr:fused MFS/spermidine synthase [Myxococcus sp.]